MFQKFFTNTIASKFIKFLLQNTPLPLYPSISDGDYMAKDCLYIYKTSLIKCTKSGTLFNSAVRYIRAGSNTTGDDTYTGVGKNYGDYRIINPYIFGDSVLQLTKKFNSKLNYYDPETHYYLGQYLRYYRDIYGIDLMPFYNCFNYNVITNVTLVKNTNPGSESYYNGYVMESNDKYKLISIPIKFNKTYTIAIDCTTPVLIKSLLYGDLGMIKEHGYSGCLSDYMYENFYFDGGTANNNLHLDKIKEIPNLNFNKPITYKYSNTRDDAKIRLRQIYPESEITDDMIDEDLKIFQNYEKYLKLTIQIPKNNDSTITVLEGDYTKNNNLVTYGLDDVSNVSDKSMNELLISKLKLLMMNNRSIYAFSDRLIEYLLLNVVDYQDEIYQNVERIQSKAKIDISPLIQSGVFDKNTRLRLYNLYMNKHSDGAYDINGFVDKDMEKFVEEEIR